MSVSKKTGETFMKGEGIKKATRPPDWFLREDDLNPDGSLNEEAAAKNRAIHIYASNSETAENINKLLAI